MKLWLYLKYFVFLNFCKIYNAILKIKLKFKGCHFNQVRAINSMFEHSDDQIYLTVLTKYLKDMIKYSDAESPDYIKEAEHTLFTWSGNCNDFSNVILTFIKTFRYWLPANLMIVYALNSRGHCVCIIDGQKEIMHSSNWGVFKGFKNKEEVAASIYIDWYYYVIIDKDLNLKELKVR